MIPKEPLATLQECLDLLQDDLGREAPALITLKRWSASGLLDDAKISESESSRPKFIYSKVLQVVKARSKFGSSELVKNDVDKSIPDIESDVDVFIPNQQNDKLNFQSGGELDHLINSVYEKNAHEFIQSLTIELAPMIVKIMDSTIKDSLNAIVKPLIESSSSTSLKIGNGLDNLDYIRRSMMMKYEDENVQLKNRLNRLTDDYKALSYDSTTITKISQQLSIIIDMLNSKKSIS